MKLKLTDMATDDAITFALLLANSFDPARRPADHLSQRDSAKALLGPYLPEQSDAFDVGQALIVFRNDLRAGLMATVNQQPGNDATLLAALALPWRLAAASTAVAGIRFAPDGPPVQQLKAWAALGYFALREAGGDRLRICQSPPCEELFRDRTKPGRQRFCCKRCANRFNVADHRRRQSKRRADT